MVFGVTPQASTPRARIAPTVSAGGCCAATGAARPTAQSAAAMKFLRSFLL
jgi:hypothetical protein